MKRLFLMYAILTSTILSILSLLRGWFYISSFDHFKILDLGETAISFLHGIRFDLSAAMYANSIVFLLFIFQKTRKSQIIKHLFCLLNAFLCTLVILDVELFQAYSNRMTLSYLAPIKGASTSNVLTMTLEYWPVIFFFVLFYIFFFLLYNKAVNRTFVTNINWPQKAALFFTIALFSFLSIRGGLQKKALSVSHTFNFSNGKSEGAQLKNSSLFNLIRSKKGASFPKKILNSEANQKLFSASRPGSKLNIRQPQNIVLVFIESITKGTFDEIQKKGRAAYRPSSDNFSSAWNNT